MRVLLVLAAALVLASPVGGAARRAALFVDALDTRPGALAETDLELSLPASATSVTVYVPDGYRLLRDRRPGAAIGSATVTTFVRVTSDLFVVRPTEWRAGALTVAVDPNRLVFSPPAGAVDVDLDLRGIVVNPAAPSVLTWRAVVTPTNGAAYELRSIVGVPQALTLRHAGRLLTGRLLFAGKPRPGVNVHLAAATRDDLADERELGIARTGPDGRYAFKTNALGPRQLLVIAYVNFYDAACPAPSCRGESIAPPPAQIVAVG